MAKSKYGSVNTDPCKFYFRGFHYKVSYDERIKVGDYYLDFTLFSLSSPSAIELCDTQSLANFINSTYDITPDISKRLSAKIVATDDPVLNKAGVPSL